MQHRRGSLSCFSLLLYPRYFRDRARLVLEKAESYLDKSPSMIADVYICDGPALSIASGLSEHFFVIPFCMARQH